MEATVTFHPAAPRQSAETHTPSTRTQTPAITGQRVELQLLTTLRCNLKCTYCSIAEGEVLGSQGNVSYDLDTLDAFIQKHLAGLGSELPVIIKTGHGDVASAREAFRALAIDFLEKPIDHKKLLAGIVDAFSRQQTKLVAAMEQGQIERLLSKLTQRELEVMDRVVAGLHNREIAAELGISPRTVEVHKARMMDKLGVSNVADLVRLNLQLGKAL